MKASTIINNAAIMAGTQAVGDVMEGSYSIYALGRLNAMLDSWQADGLYVPYVNEVVQTVTGSPVTIGSGQTINVSLPRFVRDTSYFRASGVDYPLQRLTEAEFNLIQNRPTTTGTPCYVYFDGKFPIGGLYFYPKPTGLELHLQIDAAFPVFADLTTDYDIGGGYQLAMEASLAELLLVGIKEVPPNLMRQAMRSRKILKQINFQPSVMALPGSVAPVSWSYAR